MHVTCGLTLDIGCRKSRLRKGGLKPWWQRTKAWLYPAVKKRKHSAAEDRDQSPSGSLAAADSLSEVRLDLKGNTCTFVRCEMVISRSISVLC